MYVTYNIYIITHYFMIIKDIYILYKPISLIYIIHICTRCFF